MQRVEFNFSSRGPVVVEAPTIKEVYAEVIRKVGSDFAHMTYARDLAPQVPLVRLAG